MFSRKELRPCDGAHTAATQQASSREAFGIPAKNKLVFLSHPTTRSRPRKARAPRRKTSWAPNPVRFKMDSENILSATHDAQSNSEQVVKNEQRLLVCYTADFLGVHFAQNGMTVCVQLGKGKLSVLRRKICVWGLITPYADLSGAEKAKLATCAIPSSRKRFARLA